MSRGLGKFFSEGEALDRNLYSASASPEGVLSLNYLSFSVFIVSRFDCFVKGFLKLFQKFFRLFCAVIIIPVIPEECEVIAVFHWIINYAFTILSPIRAIPTINWAEDRFTIAFSVHVCASS